MTSSTLSDMGAEIGVFSPLDGLVLAIVLVALARGFFIGLIRESFSIAALAGACLAVRYFSAPAAAWLVTTTRGEIGAGAAPWIAGALLAIASVSIIALVGRWLGRGVRAAGLGWADRLGGSALGAAEGALLAAILVFGATWWLGSAHPVVTESRSVVAYQEAQSYVQGRAGELPDVAAPLR
jgi:uncharacterized membrane protein required for colicin V production